jgi:hypothetical protein
MRFCNEGDCWSVLEDWVQRIKLSLSSNIFCLCSTYIAVDIELCHVSTGCICLPSYSSALIQRHTLSTLSCLQHGRLIAQEARILRYCPVTAFCARWHYKRDTVYLVSLIGPTQLVFRLHYVERRLSIYRVTFRALMMMMMCVCFNLYPTNVENWASS